MNFKKACQAYISRNKYAKQTIDRLMLWNPKKSIRENQTIMGFRLENESYKFKRKYDLPATKGKRKLPGDWGDTETNKKKLKQLQKFGLSLSQIARLYRTTRQVIYNAITYKSKRGN